MGSKEDSAATIHGISPAPFEGNDVDGEHGALCRDHFSVNLLSV